MQGTTDTSLTTHRGSEAPRSIIHWADTRSSPASRISQGTTRLRYVLAAVLAIAPGGSWLSAAGGGSPLIDAARRGDTAAVKAAVARKVDVNATEGDGATALHWAAYRDDVAAVDLLLRAGARPNAANDLRFTPLFAAAENGSAEVTRRLLAAGANPNAALLSGETVLMTAARTGDAAVVKALLAAGANPNAAERSQGQTALMWAAAQRHPAAVRELLSGGADLRARTRAYPQLVKTTLQATNPAYIVEIQQGGYTALLFAARVGDLESARVLVEHGADVNDRAPIGTDVVTVAAHSGHGGVAAFLLSKGARPDDAGAGYTALHAALLHRDEALIARLLEHGADPNAPVRRATPTRRDSVDFYLDPSYVGATPLWLAARFNLAEAVRLLAARGADARANHSPSYYVGEGPSRPKHAPPTSDPDRRLVEEGTVSPVMAAIGLGGRQPLFAADRLGRLAETARGDAKRATLAEPEVLATVAAVIEAGADPGVANADGVTALHAAAIRDYATVVAYLVERGAPRDAKTRKGQTPLDVAEDADSTAAAERLRR
jgi:ankyrin repeat protein